MSRVSAARAADPVARAAAWLTSFLAAAALATAQAVPGPPADAFGEVIEVELVTVEVWVTDGKGAPVRGLGRDAFRVFHDGAPVAVTHFAEMGASAPVAAAPPPAHPAPEPAGPAPPPAPVAPTHLVVVFDQVHLEATSRKRLARDLRDFLAAGGVSAERVLVLRLDRDLFIEAPFGSSADELGRALDRLAGAPPSSLGAAADSGRLLAELQGLWSQLQDQNGISSLRSLVDQAGGAGGSQNAANPGASGLPSSSSPEACDDFATRVEPLVGAWAEAQRSQVLATLKRLSDVAAFLAGLDGVKVLLYLSDGLDTKPGFAATSFVRGVCPAEQAGLELDTLAEELSRPLLELTRHANANRVTVYAIQGTGLQPSSLGSAKAASADLRGVRGFETSLKTGARTGLSTLADETGGRAVLNRSRFREEFEAIGGELGSFYSLSYEPPAEETGARHRIEVRPVDASLTLRHRREYLEKSSDQWLTERLEGALYLGLVDNPLGTRLGAGDLGPGPEGLNRLPLHVRVPAARLTYLDRAGVALARLKLKVMALHTESRRIVGLDRAVHLPRPGPGAGELIDFAVPLDLAPGVHLVAVALRDEGSREASFVSTTLEVKRPAAGRSP